MSLILVVDDDPTVRESIIEVLQSRDYQTIAAEGADTAVRLALTHVPDLVVSDIMMPIRDGYSLLNEFRETPAIAAIPVILMTGVDSQDRYRAGMNLGANDYLAKPFSGEQLHEAVQACLRKNRLVGSRAEEKVENLLAVLESTLPHEIRTPLNGILGFSEMLRYCSDKFSKEETTQAAEYIHSSAKRLHRLVEKLLLSARLRVMADCDSESLNGPETAILDMNPVIERLARDCATQVGRSHDLKVVCHGKLTSPDPQLLCKAIEELIDNAFKFSEPGTPVSVSMGQDIEGASVEVSDRGRGMSTDEVTRVDVFRQFNRSHFEQQGAGLGLYIAKQVIFELGGRFELHSDCDEGTTVKLLLPCADEVDMPAEPEDVVLQEMAV